MEEKIVTFDSLKIHVLRIFVYVAVDDLLPMEDIKSRKSTYKKNLLTP